jgi:V/A-type H+-transporting ATPase subunit K
MSDKMLLILLLFSASIIAPVAYFYSPKKILPPKRGKLALVINLVSFSAVFLLSTILIFTGQVYAQAPATEAGELALAAAFIGAALVTGLGAIGTGIAVSNTAAAAIGAISENENNFGKAMIFVAMAEGIAIYGLLIAFMILGRV